MSSSISILTQDIDEKISLLEEEIKKTPYHKGTEHHIGRLKARIAKLKNKEKQIKKKSGGFGFIPKKEGDATVVFIGPPSVGKSTLLKKLTNAKVRIESWPFTTLSVVPGILKYKGALIQIFDLPGIIKGAAEGLGRGREVLSAAKVSDLLVLVIDVKNLNKVKELLKEIEQVGLDKLPRLLVVNKVDLLKDSSLKEDKDKLFISGLKETGLDKLKEGIWQELKLMRIYLKPKGKKPDLEKPLILKEGRTVKDVFEKTFSQGKEMKNIILWGPSARFPAQQVGLSHSLKDKDILSFN